MKTALILLIHEDIYRDEFQRKDNTKRGKQHRGHLKTRATERTISNTLHIINNTQFCICLLVQSKMISQA